MRLLKERGLFLHDALKNIHEVGSVIPSSGAVARAMTMAMRKHTPPRRILEVGAGTGPITAKIVRQMKPDDLLDIYEINPRFTEFLARRFQNERTFYQVWDQVTIHTAGIETIEPVPTYDIIISAIPFTNFPPDEVANFFDTFATLLKPGGTFTYIEFAFGRAIFQTLAKGDEKARLKAVSRVVKQYNKTYQVKHRFVLLNTPPARVRLLQFDDR